jgi:hypothetical protein
MNNTGKINVNARTTAGECTWTVEYVETALIEDHVRDIKLPVMFITLMPEVSISF